MKLFKIASCLFLGAVVLLGARILFLDYGSSVVEGVVYDCRDNRPLAGATVQLQDAGTFFEAITFQWGGSTGQTALSDSSGRFQLSYKGGGGAYNMNVSKDGYLNASEYGEAGTIRVGLVKREPGETAFDYTRMCKRSSECLESTEVNGVIEVRDVCGPLP